MATCQERCLDNYSIFTNEVLITGLLGLFFHTPLQNRAMDILEKTWLGFHYVPTQLQQSNA